MPLNYDDYEELHAVLNAAFDERIKDRVDESVQRLLPRVDAAIEAHVIAKMREPTNWVPAAAGGELSKWIEREAKSAADHHIRLFGGCAALNELVGRLWTAGAEKYIKDEVDRRLRDIMKKISAAVPS